MTDVDGIPQVEVLDHTSDVGRVVIHVVPVADLAGSTVTAPVVGYHSISAFDEVQHLVVPVIRRQWPTVVEDDWLRGLGTPVLIEDLDAVFGCDGAHDRCSFLQ